jgi:hypothetical protein
MSSSLDQLPRRDESIAPPTNKLLTNNRLWHFFKSIPTPRILTLNVRSYRDGQSDWKRAQQQKRLLDSLEGLSPTCDIILLQETRMKSTAGGVYRHLLQPQFTSEGLRNPHVSMPNSGGTDIFVKKEFARGFRTEGHILFEGYLQVVHFFPADDTALFNTSFSVFNIYLPSGNLATV